MSNKEVARPSQTRPRFFYGYIILIAAFFTQICMAGSHSSFGVYFKPMISDFGWTRALTSGAFSVSSMVQGFSGIIMGGLNDRLGPRIVMTLCGVLMGLGFFLMSRISASWQLYLFFAVIVGIGMGGLIAPPMSTVARWFVKRRNVVTGIVIAGGGTGIFIMPLLSNWLISAYGWRDAYIILGSIVLVVMVLVSQFLKRDPAQMGLLPYGEEQRREQELDFNPEGLSLKEAVRTRQFWMVIIMFFCFGLPITTILVHIVPHATDLGISPAASAGVLSTIGAVLIAGGIVLGGVADRIGVRQTYTICFAILLVALFLLIVGKEVWALYLFAVFQGLAHGGNTTLHAPIIAELFGIKSLGLILGVCMFCSTMGGTIGPFITGYIFDVTGSYQLAFIILAICGIIGLIISALLRPIKTSGI